MSFLNLTDVSKRFGATVALDRVSLSAEAGEIHAIVGENGSGKSTLMRILAGAIKADSGTMELGGQPYHPHSPIHARKAGIAMIHQELSICGHLSIAENIVLGVEDARGGILKVARIRERAQQALSALGHGDLDPDLPAKSLPLAMQQVVEIARSVAERSRLVILDEPTSSLTEADIEHLFSVMRLLKQSGCTILYISHFLNEIHEICDRLTVLRDGQMVGGREVAGISDEEIVKLMVGRDIDEMYPRSARTPGEPILELDHLAGVEKPHSASLSLRRGEVLGIAGLNGSGRTEMLRAVFGLDKVQSGQIRVASYSGLAGPARRWRQGVGLLSENRKEEGLLLNMSIAENIDMAGLDKVVVSPSQQEARAAKWIETVRVKCQSAHQNVGELSGGNQQKVAIARMLRQDVDVLMMDEPTRGIDVGSKEQIYRLIDELALRGKAVLMVSSYLPELLGTCDRIAVMSKGVLSEPIPVASATQESLMKLAVGQ
ncbi:MAG TPA: sugar ABC transporter ATP-binding protein [Fimbriimonas sp.]|nr:sugar ABC transporter ATP-binding protein [Fimbriimonas sp.]